MNQALETEDHTTENRVGVRPPRWLLLAAAGVLIPLVCVGAIEAGLRIANVGYDPSLLVPCTVNGSPASCYNLFFAATFFPAGMVQTPRLYAIPAQKPAATYRIFVLGESAAMGDPDSAYGFSRYLEVMLRERFPVMKFEVVNTGSVAINSHVLLPIAEGLAGQHPDLFIIYSGYNEVVGPYGPGTVLTSAGMSIPFVRSSIYFHTTRIGQLVTRLGTQKRDWRGMELFLDKQVPATSPLMAQAYANFERNLRDTIVVGQQAGARVIVATVATNLRDCAPFASQHKNGLKEEDLASWNELVQQGNNLEIAGSHADAVTKYVAALKIDDQYAELEFRIARSLWSVGEYKSAQEHFQRARDLDTLRFRADSHINEINRRVAASVPGATLVDAEAILSGASRDGITGSDFIYEHVHLTPEGNYLLARAMFVEIAKQLPEGGGAQGSREPLSQTDCERLLALTRYDRARMAAEMLNRLQKPPFTTQLNHAEQLLSLAPLAQRPDETPNETAAQYQFAIARAPEDKMLHLRFGSFLFPYNRMAAAQELGMAQPWDGYPVFLPDGTQVR